MRDTPYGDRKYEWRGWLQAAHAKVLVDNRKRLAAAGASPVKIAGEIARKLPRPWDLKTTVRVQGQLQKHIYAKLRDRPEHLTCARVMKRMTRWRMQGNAEQSAITILRNVRALPAKVTPRVLSAVLSTLYNRWTTTRRFRAEQRNTCLLCDKEEDSIERYLECDVTRTFAANRLRLTYNRAQARRPTFFLELPPLI